MQLDLHPNPMRQEERPIPLSIPTLRRRIYSWIHHKFLPSVHFVEHVVPILIDDPWKILLIQLLDHWNMSDNPSMARRSSKPKKFPCDRGMEITINQSVAKRQVMFMIANYFFLFLSIIAISYHENIFR